MLLIDIPEAHLLRVFPSTSQFREYLFTCHAQSQINPCLPADKLEVVNYLKDVITCDVVSSKGVEIQLNVWHTVNHYDTDMGFLLRDGELGEGSVYHFFNLFEVFNTNTLRRVDHENEVHGFFTHCIDLKMRKKQVRSEDFGHIAIKFI